nr:MTH1187 family thiamine-binding protein [Shouchella shacheensis]
MGKGHLACAYYHKEELNEWVKPVSGGTFAEAFWVVAKTAPLWFNAMIVAVILAIVLPPFLPIPWDGLPFYSLFYLLFGTHFLFPHTLKQFHGAEHKVFSVKGRVKKERLRAIQQAAITNRGCSTNVVVVYFLSVLCLTAVLLLAREGLSWALSIGSYAALIPVGLYGPFRRSGRWRSLDRFLLRVSFWLQRHVTTAEPDRKHLLAAVASYRQLGYAVFSKRLVHKRLDFVKKERKKMAIADVTIIPVGTNSPSVSAYVARIQKVLEAYEGTMTYEMTPMSTLIEAELSTLLDVIATIHEVPFEEGAERVATTIRIDDRRDKASTMKGKRASVQKKLENS